MNKCQALLILFILGAGLGALYDSFHVWFGVASYTNPTIFHLSWWVFPEFGLAAVLIGISHPWGDRLLHRPHADQSWGEISFDILCFGFIYLLSAALAPHPVLCALTLLSSNALMWYVSDKTWQGGVLAILTAIVGTGFEMGLTTTGHFFYTHPHIGGVPFWLPLLYISASISVGNLGRKLFPGVNRSASIQR